MSKEPDDTRRAQRRVPVRRVALVALGWMVVLGLAPPGAGADERATLDGLEKDLVETARAHSAANRELADVARRIEEEQARVADAGRRRDSAAARVQEWARVAYKSGGTVYLSFLWDDPNAAGTRSEYIERLAQKSRRSGDEARAASEDAEAHLSALRDLEGRARRHVSDLQRLQQELEQKQVEQQRRLDDKLAAEQAASAAAATGPAAAGTASPGEPSPGPAAVAPSGPGASAPAPASPTGGRSGGVFEVTCYAEHGLTASGRPTGPGVAATDPRVIPRGTSFIVEGYGVFTSWDTGGAIKGNRIDIWNASEAWCNNFGRRNLNVTIL